MVRQFSKRFTNVTFATSAIRLSMAELAATIRLAVDGAVVGRLGLGAADVRVRIGADTASAPAPDVLQKLAVRGASGSLVLVSEVAYVHAEATPARLERRDGVPALWLCTGVAVDGAQHDVVAALRASLVQAPLPVGVSVVVERGCAR